MSLHPDSQKLLEMIQQSGRPSYEDMNVDQARTAYAAGRDATMGSLHPVAEIENLTVDGPVGAVPVRLYRPRAREEGALPLLVYFHGGGWVLGGIESHDGLCRRLAAVSGCAVASVEYRLAPEHPFPAALYDARAALCALVRMADDLRIDPSRIGLGGDSAGGTLAAVAALEARERNGPAIAFQLLLYPVCDMVMDTPSHTEFAEGHLLTRKTLKWFSSHYLGATDPSDWRASPLQAADLRKLPPTLILTAGCDPLRDEGEAYGRRLVEAGVPTTIWRVNGMLHGFLPMDKLISASVPTLNAVAGFLSLGLAQTCHLSSTHFTN